MSESERGFGLEVMRESKLNKNWKKKKQKKLKLLNMMVPNVSYTNR